MISNGHIRKLLLCASIIFFPFSYVCVMFEIRFFIFVRKIAGKKKSSSGGVSCVVVRVEGSRKGEVNQRGANLIKKNYVSGKKLDCLSECICMDCEFFNFMILH